MAEHTPSTSAHTEQPLPQGDPPPPPTPISAATGRRRRSAMAHVGPAARAAIARIAASDLTPAQKLVGTAIVGRLALYQRLSDTVPVSAVMADTGLCERAVRGAITRVVAASLVDRDAGKNGGKRGAVFTIPPLHGGAGVSTPPPLHGGAGVSEAPEPVENPPPLHGGAGVPLHGGAPAVKRGKRALNTGPTTSVSSGPGDLEKIDPLGNGLALVAARIMPLVSETIAVAIVRGLTARQAGIVAAAWQANDYQLRHALGGVETADNPAAYLVATAKRILRD